jgi:bifunctional enzyme Fae/Hps
MEDAAKIFGPAQAAVAKAVADAVEEGMVPKDKVDDWVIICSVFIHPDARDYRKIYHYNYGATKLALKRALTNYPSLEKVMYEKDRAKHPIMGFKVPRLWNPPYLQIALDVPDIERAKEIIRQLPASDRIIIEAGTPLVKKYGAGVVHELRSVAKDSFIISDLKTLDVGQVEVDVAFEETADAVVASGLASKETVNKFIYEARRLGIYSIVDMMDVANPLPVVEAYEQPPDVIIIHRGIDQEKTGRTRWDLMGEIKKVFKDRKVLISVAGGIDPSNLKTALDAHADIIVVGRYITQSRDVNRAARDFLDQMGPDIDLFRVHVE